MELSVEQRRLAACAQRQYGLFTLQQALRSGYTRSAVRRQIERGLWDEVHPRVFRALPAGRLAWHPALLALTLATSGVASFRSAGALFGVVPQGRLEVTVLRNVRCASRLGAHSTDSLPPVDVTVVDGIRTTSTARTLLDLASVLERRRFEDVLDAALSRDLVRSDVLASRAASLRAPARGGCAVVLSLLDDRDASSGDSWSVWERRVLRELRKLGVAAPACNHRVVVGGRTRYLDFAWPGRKVAVEFDGFAFHSSRRTFDDDRVRQNDLVDAGWLVFRLTSTAIRADAACALAPIARAIRATR